MKPPRLVAALAIGLVTSLAVSSCALLGGGGTPDGVADFAGWARNELGELPGVVRVDADQYPAADSSYAGGPGALDADAWGMDLSVVVDAAVTAAEISAVAEATRAFSAAHAGSAPWAARVTIDETAPSSVDAPALDRLRVDVYPEVWRTPAEAARAALEGLALPTVASVSVVGAVPSVQTVDAGGLVELLDAIEPLPLWADGGNLSTVDGRVRLADVPELVTRTGLHAIVDAALAHPGGQFWLEAANVGARFPELYVDGVSTDEAASIAASFTRPAMTAATASAYVLEFNIRAIGAEGATDAYGTFGGVPAP